MGYEDQVRERKAERLAYYLHGLGSTAQDVLGFDADTRVEVCSRAGVKPASPETWALVLVLLDQTATGRGPSSAAIPLPDDPLDGLPGGPR